MSQPALPVDPPAPPALPPVDPLAAARATCTSQDAGHNIAVGQIQVGQRVNVLAIGSSSTEGIGASGPQATYPAVLERLLNAAGTARTFRVFNEGRGGQTVFQLRETLPGTLHRTRPQIAIVQTGTTEALSAASPLGALEVGLLGLIADLRAQGALVILLDSQYAPSVLTERYTAVQGVLRRVADAQQVALIQRYALQERWVRQRLARPQDYLSGDGLHMNDFGYECVAMIARDMVLGAVR